MSSRAWLAGTLTLWLLLPGRAGAQVAPLDNWRSMRTPHFQVIGDVGEGELRRVAARLEQFRDAVEGILPPATDTTSAPTVVIVFKSHKTYRPFKPQYQGKPMDHLAGYFMPAAGMNLVTMTTESRSPDPDEALRIVYHELVHLMVRDSTTGIPLWLDEGLAEYYRTLDVSDGGRTVTVGRMQRDHVYKLRKEFIPIDQLVAVDHRAALYNESDKASVFYSQSWALVHYLLTSDMINDTAQAGALLAAFSGGASFADASQSTLGMTPASLDRALREYVRRDSFPSRTLKRTDRLEKLEKVLVTRIDAAEAHAAVGALLMHMGRRDEARAQLTAALARAPEHAAALAATGQLLMREGRGEEGRLYLERAAAAPGATALVHYQHAAALHEAFDHPGRPADVDAAIEAAYRRAIAAGPAPADSYAGLARLLADRRPTSRDHLDLMREAIERAPGRSAYRLTYGLMLANREAFAGARTMLAPLVANASDADVWQQASALLERIDDFEARRATYERRRVAAGVAEPWTERFDGPVRLPQLRPLESGEAQVFGILTAIECAADRLEFVIRADAGDVRVGAASIDDVAVASFRSDAIAEASCGPRATQDPVRVTHRPTPTAGTLVDGVAGEAVSVEFVPLSYQHR